MNLQESFDAVLASKDTGVPDNCGFNMQVVLTLAIAKQDPTEENIGIARAALKAQIDGDDPLRKAIDEYLAVHEQTA